MQLSVDVSLYPLTDDYVPAIIDFIGRVQQYPDVTVVRNDMSTQLFGDYDAVMSIVTSELKRTFEQHGQAVLVAKYVVGDVRSLN